MKQANPTKALNENILLLQNRQAAEWISLKDQFHITYEKIKPVNLIKKTFNDVVNSPELKGNITDNVIGITTGYLSKLVFFGASRNPITWLSGKLFQVAITKAVSRHPDFIKSAGMNIVKGLMKFRSKIKIDSHKIEQEK